MTYKAVISDSDSEQFNCELTMNHTIIGSGTYSIVIKPPIKNVKEYLYLAANIENTDIGKIFTSNNKDDFEKELKFLKTISKISAYTTFTVPVRSASIIDISELRDETEILNKLQSKKSENELFQIALGYGGISISAMDSKISFDTFILLIKKFYEGINKLHLYGIIHRDIKSANVLYDTDRQQLNIIDFGISCDVDAVFTSDEKYILSFMYMFNPPEFYAAYLILERLKDTTDFQKALDAALKPLINYTKELEIFYYEHYYKYNGNEPYNIFSYQQAFSKLYEAIKESGAKKFENIFNRGMAFKSDVYSSSFILRSLKKHIIFENSTQRQMFNDLYFMSSALNPYQRSSTLEILAYLDNI